MKKSMMTCNLCGHTFPLESHQGCPECPLQPDCSIICCPVCGFSDIDPSHSKVANWISSHLFKIEGEGGESLEHEADSHPSVADLSPGMEAVILSLQDVMEGRREQLMAYGLAPGRCVQIVQHNPVTIIKIDNTELAIEDDVAKRILIEKPPAFTKHSRRRHMRRRRLRHRMSFFRRRRRRRKK